MIQKQILIKINLVNRIMDQLKLIFNFFKIPKNKIPIVMIK